MFFLPGGQSPTDKLVLQFVYIFIVLFTVWAGIKNLSQPKQDMELELTPAKTGIKNDVINYAIKNDVIKFAIKNDGIKFAITNDVIDEKVKTISCFLTRLRNSRPMFRACYK